MSDETKAEQNYNSTSALCQPCFTQMHLLAAVFFVGMHNKPGMKPLDSQTMSGKMIDAVIKKLPFKCYKTNLSEVEYMPKDLDEIENDALLWHEKYQPKKNDILVLLGTWTHKNFLKAELKLVKLRHPASIMGGYCKQEKYILEAVEKIMKVAET